MVAYLTAGRKEYESDTVQATIIGGKLCFTVIAKDDLTLFPPNADGTVELAIAIGESNLRYVALGILYHLDAKEIDGQLPPFKEWSEKNYARS